MSHDQDQIQELAYYLWVSEGKPDGQSERHWQMAARMASEPEDAGARAAKTSTDPSAARGTTEPEQPDQT